MELYSYEVFVDIFDLNYDGTVTIDELKEYYGEEYVPHDTNNDGILSRDEVEVMVRAMAKDEYCCEFDADGNLVTGGDNDWSDWSDEDWSWEDYYGGEDWEWYYDEYDYGNDLDFLDGESWTIGPVTISYNDKASKMAAAAGALILAGITVSA